MYALIDNYDSFTYNLVHYFGELGTAIKVYRNDAITVTDLLKEEWDGIILSPGPCDPDQAGICLELIEAAHEKLPIFGVCLGHQSIGQFFGGTINRAPAPMHGKVSTIQHCGEGLFEGIKNPLEVTRYHSLTIAPETVPECLTVTAQSDDGVIMAIEHKALPIYGVQFHPESIASQDGHKIMQNFLNRAEQAKG